ncbi:MAG: MerR family transcriptional regulator [Methylovirgula sp.]
MEKSAEAYRTISEVAQDLDLPQHVLRFWETRFIQIKPLKRGGGRRYYRPEDIELLRAIRHLLYGEGYTIKGVQKILKEQGARTIASSYGSAAFVPGTPPPAHLAQDFDDWEDEPEAGEAAGEPDVAAFERAPQGAHQGTHSAHPGGHHGAPRPPQPVEPAPRPHLSPAERQSLQDLLAELTDCARLLDAARGR